MIICKVVGHLWATKKDEKLNGQKLMIVRECESGKKQDDIFVAADMVGAGVGELVLVVTGSTARKAGGSDSLPVDSAIVAIIDSLEIDRSK